MLNKFIIYFLIFINSQTWADFIKDDELKISSESYKKYNLSICAIFKDEAKNLQEWLEYHRRQGIDHFYLYNTGSKDSYRTILIPYINEGLVTLVNWPEPLTQKDNYAYQWALNTQIPAYENAVNFLAKDETKWLVFVNIDEFLVCPGGNMTDLLKDYDACPGISLSLVFFEGDAQVFLPQKKLFSKSLQHMNPYIQVVDKSVAKMIFKPDQCKGFTWPPYQCCFEIDQPCPKVDPQNLRISCRIRNLENFQFEKKTIYKHDDLDCYLSKENVDLLDERALVESHNWSIYEHIPEFLKKLKQKAW